MQSKHLTIDIDETFFKQAKTSLKNGTQGLNDYFSNLCETDSALDYSDLVSLSLVQAILMNDVDFVNHALSLDFNTLALTTYDSENRSPIPLVLNSGTNEEIIYSFAEYIKTHKFQKVVMDADTLQYFQFSIYGGEYATRKDTIEQFIKPLYDEDQVLQILGEG